MPISYVNWFMYKVKLSTANYVETSNFLEYNAVETLDDRFNFLSTEKLYEFVNSPRGILFTDKMKNRTIPSVTYDNMNYKP